MFLSFRENAFWERIKTWGNRMFPMSAFVRSPISQNRQHFCKEGTPLCAYAYRRLHMQCVRDEIQEIISRNHREMGSHAAPWDTFQEASLVCHLFLMHFIKCHQRAYGRLPAGRATVLKQG